MSWILDIPLVVQIFLCTIIGTITYFLLKEKIFKNISPNSKIKGLKIFLVAFLIVPIYLGMSFMAFLLTAKLYPLLFPCQNPRMIDAYFSSCFLYGAEQAFLAGIYIAPAITSVLLFCLYKFEREHFSKLILYWAAIIGTLSVVGFATVVI